MAEAHQGADEARDLNLNRSPPRVAQLAAAGETPDERGAQKARSLDAVSRVCERGKEPERCSSLREGGAGRGA